MSDVRCLMSNSPILGYPSLLSNFNRDGGGAKYTEHPNPLLYKNLQRMSSS